MSTAATHLHAAEAARAAGNRYDAAVHQRRAIAMLREGDPLALGRAVRQLAEILIEGGEVQDAATPVAEMMALYRAHPEAPPPDRADALRCAARHADSCGDDETARAFWGEARNHYAAARDGARVAEADARIAALDD